MARAMPARFNMPPLISAGIEVLEALEADERELERRDLADLGFAERRVLAERQADVLGERHRAEEGAALVHDAETLQHLLSGSARPHP